MRSVAAAILRRRRRRRWRFSSHSFALWSRVLSLPRQQRCFGRNNKPVTPSRHRPGRKTRYGGNGGGGGGDGGGGGGGGGGGDGGGGGWVTVRSLLDHH